MSPFVCESALRRSGCRQAATNQVDKKHGLEKSRPLTVSMNDERNAPIRRMLGEQWDMLDLLADISDDTWDMSANDRREVR